MKKIIISTLVLSIFFLGCSFDRKQKKPELAVQKQEATKAQKSAKTSTSRPKIISSMVRGIILSQTFNTKQKLWSYELKVVDLLTDAIKRINITYSKKLYRPGDLVYAVFDKNNQNKITKIYLIEKNYEKVSHLNIKKKRVSKKSAIIKHSKAKKTPWIGVPKEETIKLK